MQFLLHSLLLSSALVAASPLGASDGFHNEQNHITNLETESGQHRLLCHINQVRQHYSIPPLHFDTVLHVPAHDSFEVPDSDPVNTARALLDAFGIHYNRMTRVDTVYCSYIDQCVRYLFNVPGNADKLLDPTFNKAGIARWDKDNDDHVAVVLVADGQHAAVEDKFCLQVPQLRIDNVKLQN